MLTLVTWSLKKNRFRQRFPEISPLHCEFENLKVLKFCKLPAVPGSADVLHVRQAKERSFRTFQAGFGILKGTNEDIQYAVTPPLECSVRSFYVLEVSDAA